MPGFLPALYAWSEKVMYQGASLRDWLLFILVSTLAYLILKQSWNFGLKRFGRWATWTSAKWDDLVFRAASGGARLFLVSASVYASATLVDMPAPIKGVVTQLTIVATLVQVAIWATRFLTEWSLEIRQSKDGADAARATTVGALSMLGKVTIWVIVLLFVLDNLGVNITALATGLGIGGVAVALALQNILGDLFASLSISLDKPFIIGDFITVDGFLGTVEHVGLKTTRLRSLSGELLVFSNADLLKSRIRNFKHMTERRVVFKIGIEYGTPIDKVRTVPATLRTIIEQEPFTRFDRAHFQQFGAYSLDFEVVYFVLAPDYMAYMDAQQNINLKLYQAFKDQGIEFAFPTQVVQMQTPPRIPAETTDTPEIA